MTFVQFSNIKFWRKNNQDFWHKANMLQKHLPGLILFVACVWPLDIFTFAAFWLPQSMSIDIMVMLDGDKIGKKYWHLNWDMSDNFPFTFGKWAGKTALILGANPCAVQAKPQKIAWMMDEFSPTNFQKSQDWKWLFHNDLFPISILWWIYFGDLGYFRNLTRLLKTDLPHL